MPHNELAGCANGSANAAWMCFFAEYVAHLRSCGTCQTGRGAATCPACALPAELSRPPSAWHPPCKAAACTATLCRYNNLLKAPSTYKGQTRVRFITKVVAKAGNVRDGGGGWVGNRHGPESPALNMTMWLWMPTGARCAPCRVCCAYGTCPQMLSHKLLPHMPRPVAWCLRPALQISQTAASAQPRVAPLMHSTDAMRLALPLCFPPSTQVITLERYLPYTIQAGINSVVFRQAKGAVRDSGVEGITFQFAWQLYAGHHLVRASSGLLALAGPHSGLRCRQAMSCWEHDGAGPYGAIARFACLAKRSKCPTFAKRQQATCQQAGGSLNQLSHDTQPQLCTAQPLSALCPPARPLAAPAGEGLECHLPVGDCRLLGAPDWHGERRQRGAHPRCARCGGEMVLITVRTL